MSADRPAPEVRGLLRPGTYRDSVFLMRAALRMRGIPGVAQAELLMATESNLRALRDAGLLPASLAAAGPRPDDLLIAAAGTPAAVGEALAEAIRLLEAPGALGGDARAAGSALRAESLGQAIGLLAGATLALISVPGPHVRRLGMEALGHGLNLLIFSSNVPVEDEVALKTEASRRGLLVMGPDCGTAIVAGTGLGFANRVRRGSIGLVGASGTGLQEVSVLIHRAGAGVSHALGTGGRDVRSEIGGLTMRAGIDLLARDPGTEVIVLVSKPPSPETAWQILEHLAAVAKPAVVCFLGLKELTGASVITLTATLEEAAVEAVARASSRPPGEVEVALGTAVSASCRADARAEAGRLAPSQRFVRGLFSGGTLAGEAALVLAQRFPVASNTPFGPVQPLGEGRERRGHAILDLGDEAFTRGRPHPMLEPSLRLPHLFEEAEDARTAVVLLDFVLGDGAHADPVGVTREAIVQARHAAAEQGRYLPIVASVCGTEADPQGFDGQVQMLLECGVLVAPSNAGAARLAGEIAAERRVG